MKSGSRNHPPQELSHDDGKFAPFFQPPTREWFVSRFGSPTQTQSRAWEAIHSGADTLISAPTGSGKTLAAFLSAIDELVAESVKGPLPAMTRVVYVSPLKALSGDVEKNLAEPLAGISAAALHQGHMVKITTALRTGDTPASERSRMARRPPHFLVTTPEGLYALVTSRSGRATLGNIRCVIVDEIHALATDRRGSHLALTLERLDDLVGNRVQRIGLSATQKPLDRVGRFLVGASNRKLHIVDEGHQQPRDLQIVTPVLPLGAVASHETMEAIYDQVAQEVRAHRTTVVFVNSRRQCERVARHLADRLGEASVAAHHGSLSPEIRLVAERRLRAGDLRVLVATSSLELGIDVGDVNLVIQLGSLKRIAMLLQRVGRANHWHGGIPKGRLYPLSRDDLIESVALLRCVARGELDLLEIPEGGLDVLAQQIVAAVASREWHEDELFALVRRAYSYRELTRQDFDAVLAMLACGTPTPRGRRGRLVVRDSASGTLKSSPGALMLCLCSGGTIADSGDYKVRLEPEGTVVGNVAEDFAIHQLPGHVIQLGSSSWKIVSVRSGEVNVRRAKNPAPYMPVWFGEIPPRSPELCEEISKLREEVSLAKDNAAACRALADTTDISPEAALECVRYLREIKEDLGHLPGAKRIVAERFADEAGGSHVVVHSPWGVRVHRAWALALRERLVGGTGVEIQAVASDDGLLLSLPVGVNPPGASFFELVRSNAAPELLRCGVLSTPLFVQRWRAVSTRALLVPRQRGARRVSPHLQRTLAADLLDTVFPEPRVLSIKKKIPEHPLVREALRDCLHEAMDFPALQALLRRIEHGEIGVRFVERATPSRAAQHVLTARPPAFLDAAPLMDRRARNVTARPFPIIVNEEPQLTPEALERVESEIAPRIRSIEDLADFIELGGIVPASEVGEFSGWLGELAASSRVSSLRTDLGELLWFATRRLGKVNALLRSSADTADQAKVLAPLLRARLETLGPKSLEELAGGLGLSTSLVKPALEGLLEAGDISRGSFDPRRQNVETWCLPRILGRAQRLAQSQLRAEVEPVDQQRFFRFLLHWHGLIGADRPQGREGLISTLTKLDGLELPAELWELEILPARVVEYRTDDLDELGLSGRFGWGRLSPTVRGQFTRSTGIALYRSEHLVPWIALAPVPTDPPRFSHAAGELWKSLSGLGPAFLPQLEATTRLLPSQLEEAFRELIGVGLLRSDSFAGARAFLSRPKNPRVRRLEVARRVPTGRWSLLTRPEGCLDPVDRDGYVLTYARSILQRYGVVWRTLVLREKPWVSWIEILRVLRRLEARGEIRGGYFVEGVDGEQYALPEAFSLLRESRNNVKTEALISMSAADPLNLAGVFEAAGRRPRNSASRLLFRDGCLIGYDDQTGVQSLGTEPLSAAEIGCLQRHSAVRRVLPAAIPLRPVRRDGLAPAIRPTVPAAGDADSFEVGRANARRNVSVT